MISGRPAKILLIDSNVYFAKRLSDALKKEGFDVTSSTQPAFALTTLEYDAPTAVVCATHMREMGALEIAKIIHADPKNATLPIIALGDGSQRALMEAFQAGCEDYIDRQRPPAVIALHIRNIIISKAEGFQPTQMLAQADTSLSGSLTHHDLPGVLQMLGHAHQTGALHINAGATDAIVFFDAGNITHAECGNLFGDEAVIHIIKNCVEGGQGVYKFVYGSTSSQHTVLRNATDLMLDAMREYDESSRNSDSVDFNATSTADSIGDPIDSGNPEAIDSELPPADAEISDESSDSEPSLFHLLDSSTSNASPASSEPPATNSVECGDTAPPFTNEDSSPITPLDHPTPVNCSAPERDSISTHPLPDADPSANVGAQDEYARRSDRDTVPYVETESAPSVAQALLPVADLRDTTATTLEHLTALESDCENEGPIATTTAVLKRSDILQSQLSTHPTTITDRILSDLRDHNSPIDRALAELLSAQINGTLEPDSADETTLNETEFTAEVQDLNAYQQQTNDSDNTDQSLNQNHVHHSDESSKELP